MQVPTKFRSRYTGQEIDQILSSVKNKIDAYVITNDFKGGTDKIASAELAKILYDSLKSFEDPNYLTQLILSIPDNNIYTDAEKAKLANISDKFKGVYLNTTDRDNNLNTTNYIGGELCVIRNIGEGLGEIEYWDQTLGQWTRLELYDQGIIEALTIVISPIQIFSLNTTTYTTMELIVTAKKTISSVVNVQTIKILVNCDGTNLYWSTMGNIGNNNSLITLSAVMGSPNASIIASGVAGCVITGKMITKF